MNRLRAELRRLYAALPGEVAVPSPGPMGGVDLIGPMNEVRALVVEVVHPVGWSELGKLWQGVQTEFEWPPPAIAVSGVDGLQLWFSLRLPVAVPQGHDLLAALTAHFLPEVRPRHLRIWPARAADASRPDLHARPVPAEQGGSGNWSAYVAPDLAPVFADTPWLDIPPGEEGQMNLLRGLRSTAPGELEMALQRLSAAARDNSSLPTPTTPALPTTLPTTPTPTPPSAAPSSDDPVRFLRQVMNDDTVPLALRIEAAKALLPR